MTKNRTTALVDRCFLSLAGLSVGLAACGGRAGVADPGETDCPPGYTCVAVCPPHETCTPTGGGGRPPVGSGADGGDAPPPSYDAGSGPTADGGYPEGSTPPSSGAIAVLDYRVVDAEFSGALSSIVMVSDSPSNTLHIDDVAGGTDRAVTLPLAPVAVAVDPSGLQAAVAFNAHVAWIDLQAGTIKAMCDLSSDAFDIVLTSRSIAYVMPKTDQWVSLHAIDLTTCTESNASSFGGLYASSHVALHPSENAVFAADQGLSPSRIDRCDITQSPIACNDAEGTNDWGTYGFCGNLWMSADGARIYSACGVTLRVPGNVTGDLCTYGGTLANASTIRHLTEFPSVKRLAFVPGVPYSFDGSDPSNDDAVVRVHETDFLGFVAEYQLPAFPLTGTFTATAHGRFVFGTPSMGTLYVIVQADPTSGALHDFGIATITP